MDIRVAAENAEPVKRVCPNCDVQEDPSRYFGFVGIEIQGIYDGVLIWVCPICKYKWPRFRPPGRLYDYAVLMIEKDNV